MHATLVFLTHFIYRLVIYMNKIPNSKYCLHKYICVLKILMNNECNILKISDLILVFYNKFYVFIII